MYIESMRKKLGGERGYLALEDLRIKSKFPRFQYVDSWGRAKWGEKKPESEEKEEEEGSGRKVKPELKHKLGASHPGAKLGTKIYGAELGAKVTGVELSAMSPSRWSRAEELGARDVGTKTC